MAKLVRFVWSFAAVSALLLLPTFGRTGGVAPAASRVSARASGQIQPHRRDQYGIQFLGSEAEFGLLRELGVRWTRVAFGRDSIHKAPQEYEWTHMDSVVARIRADGIQILAELWPSPQWDTSEPGTLDYGLYPPRNYDQWGDYVFQVVSRYRTNIRHWEVWNEPDILPPSGNWNGSPAEYARLLAIAYREIKRADPSAQVVLGGFIAEQGAEIFYQQLLDDPNFPADNNFDIMNIHAYVTPLQSREKVTLWRSLVPNKPLWVTEVGWPADPAKQALDPQFCCDEQAQANYLRTILPDLIDLGADKVFWFALIVPPSEWDPFFDSYGLVETSSLRRRPAFTAFKDLLASLPP